AVEPLEPARVALVLHDPVGAVEIRGDSALAQLAYALLSALEQLVHRAELNGVRGTRLRARGLEAVLQAIVAQRALVRLAVPVARDVDHAERTRAHTVAASVADVLLHVHRIELGADDRAGGTRLETRCIHAVLADVAHEDPSLPGL